MNCPPLSMITKKEWLLLILIIFAALSLRMFFLHEPLECDEGLYAYIGQEILRGDIPYRDAIDHKPPGIHYIYAAIIATFGATPEGIRIGSAICSIGTLMAIFFCTRRVYGTKAGLWSSLLFGIFSSGPLIRGAGSNTEVFMVLPIVLSMYLLIVWFEKPNIMILTGSGLLVGCALVIKTVALPHVIAGLVFTIVLTVGKRNWIKTATNAAVFLASSSVPLLAVMLFFYLNGSFHDYYYWTIEFNKMYGKTSLAAFFSNMRHGFSVTGPELLPLVALATPVVLLILSKLRTKPSLFLVASVLAALLGLSMPTRFYEHYFIQIVPPLAILAGASLAYLLQQRSVISMIALAPFVASVIFWFKTDYKYYLSYSPEQVSNKKYGSDEFVNSTKIAKYIIERTASNDYIYQWGFKPELYFLTNRRAPNRYTLYFTVGASEDPWQASIDLANSIIAKRPVYLVVTASGVASRSQGYDVIRNILAMNYIHEIDLYGSQLWRIR